MFNYSEGLSNQYKILELLKLEPIREALINDLDKYTYLQKIPEDFLLQQYRNAVIAAKDVNWEDHKLDQETKDMIVRMNFRVIDDLI